MHKFIFVIIPQTVLSPPDSLHLRVGMEHFSYISSIHSAGAARRGTDLF